MGVYVYIKSSIGNVFLGIRNLGSLLSFCCNLSLNHSWVVVFSSARGFYIYTTKNLTGLVVGSETAKI